MIDPHLWWYVTRASAIIAWALMTGSVLWGILLSTRVLRRIDSPAWLQDLHRYLGGAALVMVGLHLVSLMLDPWLKFTAAEALVPFATDFKPLPVALGILAFYLLVAVQGSSLLMQRLPRRFWKFLHRASYLTVLLVSLHAGFTGTDVGTWWYRAVAITLIGLSTLAVIVRMLAGARFGGSRAEHPQQKRSLIVVSVTTVADGVRGIRLELPNRRRLPAWQPGAHLTLHLPNGLQRQYSLCGDPAERHHYDIAVLHTRESAGGSAWIHQNLLPGMTIEVSGPQNHFAREPAPEYLFVAGGIGITPIKAMIESLPAHQVWRLIYAGRSRSTMAFADDLAARYPGPVRVHAADENDAVLHLATIVAEGSPEAEVYCCGPESLMTAVAALVPAKRMHLERFVAVRRAAPAAEPVLVSCRKSRREVLVPAGQSILTALEQNGLPVLGSCRTGVCGTCELRVVAGAPLHLDSVMDDADKDRLRIIYPCVSRASTPILVLDV
ncbi:2Fe-2S iron-sulfur cluster binding domain-containing protein [Cryobacterium frigoriphilum]|uniref:2Fe-2S iron-sulfur cluster binding domain-containing protein n=1 Tax=Cryobacterium frigoriphilum TaxID=1259150 RepID=A0A4R9A875_9MICO|nr:2Fe-2S iron-sulfur cluster-binding protein [Cryobacterium frigoriphilum]TFD54062.1 2Fe-2S iron-sulfur cluster binding domain-containing protein [Cryobacterium frigoriphilum]